MSHYPKAATLEALAARRAYRSKAYINLKRCYEQGRKDRMNRVAFSECRYAHIEKMRAWESGWRSVQLTQGVKRKP